MKIKHYPPESDLAAADAVVVFDNHDNAIVLVESLPGDALKITTVSDDPRLFEIRLQRYQLDAPQVSSLPEVTFPQQVRV